MFQKLYLLKATNYFGDFKHYCWRVLHLHIGPSSWRLSNEQAPVVPSVAHTWKNHKDTEERNHAAKILRGVSIGTGVSYKLAHKISVYF